MTMRRRGALLIALAFTLASCGRGDDNAAAGPSATPSAGQFHEVLSASRVALQQVSGTAAPVAEATLGTKLMGTITAVLVQEGDRVRAGQPLVRIDARDLVAKESQVAAGRTEADALLREAELHAQRMRALHADDAAPQAQLDAAETGLARARAAVAAAAAGAAELAAVRDYSVIAAPFAGTVVRRHVDPGSFAAPGTPLLVVQDASRLRVSASVAPSAVRHLVRGTVLDAVIEGELASAVIEGVVPAPGASLYTVNAIVENGEGRYLPGGAATLSLPGAVQQSLVVPAAALVRRGSLIGVHVRTEAGTELRWIRLGPAFGDSVEVSAGIRAGDQVLVPASGAAGR